MPKVALGGTDAAVSLRLPRELLDRLKAAAGNRSVSEEIRQRLESSFVAGPADPETVRLIEAIAYVARNIGVPWEGDPFTFTAFKVAVDALLASSRPDGELLQKPKPDSPAAARFGPDASPEAVGRKFAAMAARVGEPQ